MTTAKPPSSSEQSKQYMALVAEYVKENGMEGMTAVKLDAFMKERGFSVPATSNQTTDSTSSTEMRKDAKPVKRKYFLCNTCGYYSRFKETYAEAKSGLAAIIGLAAGFGVLYRERKKYGCLNCGNTAKNKLKVVFLDNEPSPIVYDDKGPRLLLR